MRKQLLCLVLIIGTCAKNAPLRCCLAIALCLRFTDALPDSSMAAEVDRYVAPYVSSNNFSGVVLIAQQGKVAYQKTFGFADISAAQKNTFRTQFYLASMSMQFTAAAVMRLVELGRIRLDQSISGFVPGLPNGDTITVRQLLEQTSGLPDVNALPEYPAILDQHQTADSLIAYIKNKPPRFEPGDASRGEEHSAFNVLALIVENVTHQPFASALRRLIFDPLRMGNSGIDDDSSNPAQIATGYAPQGVRDLEVAQRIHWSAKTGNASAYATANDLLKWRNAFFGDRYLGKKSRRLMLDYSRSHAGYGWFKNSSRRLGVPVFYMNGRAPGFASFLMEVPSSNLTVIVLSNIYVSAVSDMGSDLAALMLAKPYEAPLLRASAPPATETEGIAGGYRFEADFYQPNAILTLELKSLDARLRWPSDETTYLIPASKDHFIDRSYWVPVALHRSSEGNVTLLGYDRFLGKRIN